MNDRLDAFKVNISDLRHLKCKVSLEMRVTPNELAEPYCPKCNQFIHTADIEINPHRETQKKIIEMIKIIGSIDLRTKIQKEMRKKANEHRTKTKPVKVT